MGVADRTGGRKEIVWNTKHAQEGEESQSVQVRADIKTAGTLSFCRDLRLAVAGFPGISRRCSIVGTGTVGWVETGGCQTILDTHRAAAFDVPGSVKENNSN